MRCMNKKEQPDWAVVLEALYEGQYSKVDFSRDPHTPELTTYKEIAEQTPLDPSEVKDAMRYMANAGLIHSPTPGDRVEDIIIKPKGFEVAHQRRLLRYREERESSRIEQQENNEDQRAERQNQINKLIGFLTFGLLAVTFFDTAVSAVGTDAAAVLLIFEGIVIIGIGVATIKTGVFQEVY